MELRHYQEHEMVEPVAQAFREFGRSVPGRALRVLLTAPTGAGKTACFSAMTERAMQRGNGSWIMVHRDLLVRQASRSLTNWGCPHGVLSAGGEHDGQSVQVVSIQTLSGRLKRGWVPPKPKFLISDECHHACSSSWLSVFDYFKDVPTLGVTATPCRLDGKGLGAVFDRMVLGPTPLRLMEMGYLVRPQYWGVPPAQLPDLSQVGTDMGDFNKAALAKAVEDKPRLTGDVVAHYKRRANGLKFVGFACNIKHANTLRDAFVAAGVPCEVIHGLLSDDERADMVGRLERGEIRGLWSVDLISEGFDLPEVSCAICCRPTKSLSLWLQQLGRVLRLHDGKTFAVVLDHAGNLMRDGLGAAEMDREWTLEGVVKAKKDAETLPAICQCPKCFAVFLRAESCPRCEYVFPVVERKIKAVAGNLKQLSASDIEQAQKRMKALREQGMTKDLESLAEVGRKRGMKDPEGWARHVIESREAKKSKEAIAAQLLANGRKIG